jgi:hypothetical protein
MAAGGRCGRWFPPKRSGGEASDAAPRLRLSFNIKVLKEESVLIDAKKSAAAGRS